MKRTVPWLIAAAAGFVMIAAYFIPYAQKWGQEVGTWFDILAAIAFVLGGANLFTHNLQKISSRKAGWGYSAVTLIAFSATLIVGLFKVGVAPSGQFPDYAWSGAYQDEGSAFWWVYEYAINPLTSTMFALLAFYVASAAYRAFRAKNVEASLLLAAAFIVLLGRTYTGTWLTSWMPESLSSLTIPGLTVTIMSVFNTAGQRAIMIGIALGVVATSLKILLGVDRSYFGSDRE